MPRILLYESDLRLLLEKHREDIGRKAAWSDIFAGVVFVSQSVFTSYFDLLGIPGVIWKGGFVLLGFAFAVRGIRITCSSRRHGFSHDALFEEIADMNKITHPFSIVAIRDSYNKYPNRFLLYYDERWSCWFFPNYKTTKSADDNIPNICGRLSSQLKIPASSINLELKDEAVHEKYSRSDNVRKTYEHKLYNASIASFPDAEREDNFTVDGIRYRWMSIHDMENNHIIKEINSDVVSFVKECS